MVTEATSLLAKAMVGMTVSAIIMEPQRFKSTIVVQGDLQSEVGTCRNVGRALNFVFLRFWALVSNFGSEKSIWAI